MISDHYETLGVDREASQEEIKKSYYAHAQKCHPDLHPDDKDAIKRFQQIHEAFHVLGDPMLREQYNRTYDAAFRREPPPPPTGFGESSTTTFSGPPPFASEATSTTRRRRKRNSGVEVIKAVLGGFAGIILAALILNYGFGIDPIGLWSQRKANTASEATAFQREKIDPRNVTTSTPPSPSRQSTVQSANKPVVESDMTPKTRDVAPQTDRIEVPSNKPAMPQETGKSVDDSKPNELADMARLVHELRNEVAHLKSELSKSTRTGPLTARIPRDAVEFRGNRYLVILSPASRYLALAYCESVGGHLVRIESAAEHDFVFGLIKNGNEQDYFIDGSDEAVEGEWVFSNGQPIPFIKWDKSPGEEEPNNFQGSEHAMSMHNRRNQQGTIADTSSNTNQCFICEWESDGNEQYASQVKDHAIQPSPKWVSGTWEIKYLPNKSVHTFVIGADGHVVWEGKEGKLKADGESIVLELGGKIERFTFVTGRVFTEHFFSKNDYEKNIVDQIGIGALVLQ